MRAHSTDNLTAVVNGATLVAAHRPNDDNVRVWLTNNETGGKLATLGVSVNPFCPGENFINVNGSSTEICRRYAESAVLTAANHTDGGFAVIATTGQTPVIIDGRTVAVSYRLATITSSRFRSAPMFSRTSDGGYLYARAYSDAVLSSSALRTISFAEIGVVTIHNIGGSLLVQDGNVDRFTTLSPPNTPSLTIYSSRIGDPDKAITIASPAPGGNVSAPITLRESERVLSVSLTGSRIGNSYRRNYLSGGFWLHAPANAESVADYEFGVFAGGSDELSAEMIPPLAGIAVYRGEAAGVYASSRPGREEVSSFRANAVLTADFSSANLGVIVQGRVAGFVLAHGTTLQGVAITLDAAERANANTGLFSGDTGGGRFSGKWGGNFYGAPGRWAGNHYEDLIDGEVVQPDAIGATFGGASNDGLESVAGFIGARRELVGMINASFSDYPTPPLRVNAAAVWDGREVGDDGRFFAYYDGADKLRAAGLRFGALEIRHLQNQTPSALSDGDSLQPFFATDDGMQMRWRFGGGLFGFAFQSRGDNDYRQVGVLLKRTLTERIGVQYSFSHISESGTLLGGKWGGLLRGGESRQVRAKLSFALNDNWALFAAAEKAKTQAQTGGIIRRIDGLRAFGWRGGAAAKNIWHYGDRLRFAFVRETAISGGTALLLLATPSSAGWQTIESALPLASDNKHRTIAAAYGFAPIAAAHRKRTSAMAVNRPPSFPPSVFNNRQLRRPNVCPNRRGILEPEARHLASVAKNGCIIGRWRLKNFQSTKTQTRRPQCAINHTTTST